MLLSGEPGMAGESQLIAALSERSQRATPGCALCSPHRKDSALILHRAAGTRLRVGERDDKVEEKLGKLRALLAPGSQRDDDVGTVERAVSLSSSATDLSLSPQRKREKLYSRR